MNDDNQTRQQSLRSALELPMIDLLSFPENERGAVGQVSNNLSKLVMIAESFQDALDLFVQSLGWKHQVGQASEESRQSGDYANVDALSNSTRRLIGWMSIAARHGAMLAYTAAQIRQKNAGEIRASPTLDALVDKSLVKASGKTFEAAFPAIYKVRLSAAHPHELGTTAKDYDLHYLKDGLQTNYASIETGTVFVEGMIEVDGYSLKYSSSIEGKYVQYTLSPQTFNQLVASIQTYLAAFKKADYSLMRESGIR